MSIEEIKSVRLAKLKLLKKAGMEAYPARSLREISLKQAADDFEELAGSGVEKWLAGRVMSIRGQGGIAFATLYDGTDSFQILLKKNTLGAEKFVFWNDVVDIGDFVEVRGIFFRTQRGERTLEARDWRMLAKSLLPLPEKWHGLTDTEERLRKRYLDILVNPELKDLFVKKAKFWEVIRAFMKEHGFLEVETPTLEITTGGAEARPFQTHHNDFAVDVYLRISVGELWQKKLLAAGFPRTFEIGRVYRNEGSSPEHLQEFTNLEFYAAYADYRQGMELVKDMYRRIAADVFGRTDFESRGYRFDLSSEWPEVDYVSKIKEETGVDILSDDEDKMEIKIRELGVEHEGRTRERLTDTLWKYCRRKISGPVFLVNHPKLVSPLSKAKPENPLLTERFQIILAGSEVGNGFSELNDPLDQRERFEVQRRLIESGDEEAMMPDWEFVEMLEHAMPPAFGFGMGERFFSFLAGKPLRETTLFPLMRPK